MDKALLFKEIESLPSELQRQVADFVAFLKLKYSRPEASADVEFTEEELAELDRRWDEFEKEPDSASALPALKNWVKSTYGV